TYIELAAMGVLESGFALDEAREYAARALELDPDLADIHASLGLIAFDDWNWTAAENFFNRALLLNPSYSFGHMMFGNFLATIGRFDAAIAEAKMAQDLDPGSLSTNFVLGSTYYLSRQYPSAIEAYLHTLDLKPEFSQAHEGLAKVYEMAGMPD